MENRFSEYQNSINELNKLVQNIGIGKNFHNSVSQELDSISKNFRNSIIAEKSLSELALGTKLSEFQPERLFNTKSLLSPLYDLDKNNLILLEIDKLKNSLGLAQQESTWKKLIKSNSFASTNRIQLEAFKALTAWDGSLAKIIPRLQENNFLQNKPTLSKRLLEPSRVYTDFISKTTQRIELASSKDIFKALTASLHLTETQFLSASKVLSDFTTETDDNDDNVSSPRTLNLFDVQQEELISSVESVEQDEQFLIDCSLTAELSSKARTVLNLITQCNEASKISGKSEIFKPTNKILEIFSDLPWLVANDKRSLADIVDCLYFLFYEGAGKDNLRFLTANQGVLHETECDFIWCVKHLRNKWLRHDVDHGKQSQINKSWKALSAQFNWLKLNHFPISQEHFLNLHYRLVVEAEKFLNQILCRLIENTL